MILVQLKTSSSSLVQDLGFLLAGSEDFNLFVFL